MMLLMAALHVFYVFINDVKYTSKKKQRDSFPSIINRFTTDYANNGIVDAALFVLLVLKYSGSGSVSAKHQQRRKIDTRAEKTLLGFAREPTSKLRYKHTKPALIVTDLEN